ncbi:hypothetical protein AB6Q13_11395 [Ralstonia solanacearum]|uniref:hypothetical protein n=1 Tax=Ralstonia solanacearum TaxID=305 RepID=UPI001FF75215|nr:hypothetical protein [Ralstonia solanacearum]MDB0507716.1 hypothetical protein [Ralstonia solanacearum]MDB0511986.1 hypothetical protein [Ralstonia solanacearum]MDB0566526.1 hypothetical protein [Ralstonia solanacearum]MDB0575791.1 hypothetical protein [Ralstonia solanacearum]
MRLHKIAIAHLVTIVGIGGCGIATAQTASGSSDPQPNSIKPADAATPAPTEPASATNHGGGVNAPQWVRLTCDDGKRWVIKQYRRGNSVFYVHTCE